MYEATATFGSEGLVLDKMLPGDGIKFNIEVRNESDVTIKFRTIVGCAEDDGLYDGLMVKLNNVEYDGVTAVDNYATLAVGDGNKTVPVEIVLPDAAGSEYGNKKCTIVYKVEAIQGNAATEEPVEGIALYTKHDLYSFAKKVNAGNTYRGETVVLMSDIDLSGELWTPAGNVKNYPGVTFAGTFDGRNHTISNMHAVDKTTENNATAGFFGSISGVVKNLKFVNATVESNHYAGVVCGYSSANNGMKIENCHVENSVVTSIPEWCEDKAEYDNGDKAGGIIGCMAYGDVVTGCSVKNIEVRAYRDLGGIVGSALGNGYAATVTNNKATNVTLYQDNVNGYKNERITTFGGIVGRGDSGTDTTGCTEEGVSYKFGVTPEKVNLVDYALYSNSMYIFNEGHYVGTVQMFLRSSENITFIADENASFERVEIGYHAGQDTALVQKTNSKLSVSGFRVTGDLFINAADQVVVAENNVVGNITVKTHVVEGMRIEIRNNTINASESSYKYGVYIVPNKTAYTLIVDGNTFTKTKSHSIAVQGCGDGSAVTAADSIAVTNNEFVAIGENGKAAFKIWEDTKLAPTDGAALNAAANALVGTIKNGNNRFGASFVENNGKLGNFYGTDVEI